jgi:hypothetical protein
VVPGLQVTGPVPELVDVMKQVHRLAFAT